MQVRDGVPSDIQSLVQTSDGFLWLGSKSGLFQYDGVTFRRYRMPSGAELPNPDVVALAANPGGGLWAAASSRQVYFIKGNSIAVYGAGDGISSARPCGIAADLDGRVWLGSRNGLLRLEGTHWVNFPRSDGSTVKVRGDDTDCIRTDVAGTLWASTDNNVFHLSRGSDRLEAVERPFVRPLGLLSDRDGHAWLDDEDGVFSLSNADQGARRTVLDELNGGVKRTVLIEYLDRSGMAWGTLDGRYFRLPAAALQMQPSSDRLRAVMQTLPRDERQSSSDSEALTWLEDREGDVWVATRAGLDRFRPTQFRKVSLTGHAIAGSIAVSPTGTFWVAAKTGLLRRDPGKNFAEVPGTADVAGCGACWLLPTRDGQLYIATSDLLWRLTASGVQSRRPDIGSKDFVIHGLAEDGKGRLWASMLRVRGIFVSEDGRWTRRDGQGGVPEGAAMSLVPGEGGRMWLGYPYNVVAIVDDDRTRVFRAEQGLDIGTVLTMLPQGDKAWIGGSDGLDYFDGQKMHAVVNVRGVSMNNLSGMVMTPDGDLWLNDDAGVQRISHLELLAVGKDPSHRVDGEFFDGSDGIDGSAATVQSLPTAVRSADGLLWFKRSDGLYWVDPKHLHRNPVTPQAFVVSVRANDVVHSFTPFDLPAGTSRIQIDYTTPLLSTPNRSRFRYRLRGVDDDWMDAGGRRQAFYTNLAPGTYEFEVSAANENGVWSTAPASVSIVIHPEYWQTTQFRALCVIAVIVSLWTAVGAWYRFRMRRLVRQVLSEARIKQGERERIARDLHDTLLQSMHALLWRFHAIATRWPADDPNQQNLKEELERAEMSLEEGRKSIMATHGPGADDGTLVERLRDAGAKWSFDTGTAFEIRVENPERHIPPNVLDSVSKILTEALSNAFRHAEASRVLLVLSFERSAFVGEVSDDGNGLAHQLPSTAKEGHMGLGVMRERARALGAEFDIQSSPGAGTRVWVKLRASRVYASSSVGNWFSKLRRPVRRRWAL